MISMERIYNNGELICAFKDGQMAQNWITARADKDGRDCLIWLSAGVPDSGWVVDSLWSDGAPGTTKVFAAEADAFGYLRTLTQQPMCILARVRKLSLADLSTARIDDEGDAIVGRGNEQVYYW